MPKQTKKQKLLETIQELKLKHQKLLIVKKQISNYKINWLWKISCKNLYTLIFLYINKKEKLNLDVSLKKVSEKELFSIIKNLQTEINNLMSRFLICFNFLKNNNSFFYDRDNFVLTKLVDEFPNIDDEDYLNDLLEKYETLN